MSPQYDKVTDVYNLISNKWIDLHHQKTKAHNHVSVNTSDNPRITTYFPPAIPRGYFQLPRHFSDGSGSDVCKRRREPEGTPTQLDAFHERSDDHPDESCRNRVTKLKACVLFILKLMWEWKGLFCELVNHISWVAVITQIGRPRHLFIQTNSLNSLCCLSVLHIDQWHWSLCMVTMIDLSPFPNPFSFLLCMKCTKCSTCVSWPI